MADSSYMNVNFETLQQAEDDIAAQVAAIRTTLSNLDDDLKSNLSQWTGAAQGAYALAKSNWDTAVDHMTGALQRAGAHMRTAHDTYTATENQNVGLWS